MNSTISSQILSLNNSSQYISQLNVAKNEQVTEEVKRAEQAPADKQQNYVVNLNQNQPPKIIQLSNQIPVGLMNNAQKNQILLYQMQQKQQIEQNNSTNKRTEHSSNLDFKSFNTIDPTIEASQAQKNFSVIFDNKNQSLSPNSNIQLENCEFINSSKANLAKNLPKNCNNNTNDINGKTEAQSQDNNLNNVISGNNNNMRVFLNQDGQIQQNQQHNSFISTENNMPIQLKLVHQG